MAQLEQELVTSTDELPAEYAPIPAHATEWHNSTLGTIEGLAHTTEGSAFLMLLKRFRQNYGKYPEMTNRGMRYHFGSLGVSNPWEAIYKRGFELGLTQEEMDGES